MKTYWMLAMCPTRLRFGEINEALHTSRLPDSQPVGIYSWSVHICKGYRWEREYRRGSRTKKLLPFYTLLDVNTIRHIHWVIHFVDTTNRKAEMTTTRRRKNHRLVLQIIHAASRKPYFSKPQEKSAQSTRVLCADLNWDFLFAVCSANSKEGMRLRYLISTLPFSWSTWITYSKN